MNPKIKQLYDEAKTAHAKAQALLAEFEGKAMPAEKQTELDAVLGEVEAKMADAKRLERLGAADEFLNKPEGVPAGLFGAPGAKTAKGPFKSMGEQLGAIMALATGKARDERLFEVKALGLNEEIGSEGGWLLQPSFAQELWQRTYEVGAFASRCRKFPIPAGSNTLTINAIDETSRVTGSRLGGVQSYWIAPGATITPTKPKFRQIDLRLKKLASLYYATDEELSDVATLEATCGEFMTADMAWMLDEGIFTGSGAGMPLGVMNSQALVTIAKEAGQVALSVVAENVTKMWARCYGRSRANAVWFINQDVEPQLDLMAYTIGLGGVPAYMPPGGIADAPYGRLKGRPVIPVENCATVGTLGDILLADLSQYFLADKGGIQAASSIHVQFLTDESAFRFIYRLDGQPAWNAALTPAKGTNSLSPFVALAARA
jgi:HK97 family phage major capsid protein